MKQVGFVRQTGSIIKLSSITAVITTTIVITYAPLQQKNCLIRTRTGITTTTNARGCYQKDPHYARKILASSGLKSYDIGIAFASHY